MTLSASAPFFPVGEGDVRNHAVPQPFASSGACSSRRRVEWRREKRGTQPDCRPPEVSCHPRAAPATDRIPSGRMRPGRRSESGHSGTGRGSGTGAFGWPRAVSGWSGNTNHAAGSRRMGADGYNRGRDNPRRLVGVGVAGEASFRTVTDNVARRGAWRSGSNIRSTR